MLTTCISKLRRSQPPLQPTVAFAEWREYRSTEISFPSAENQELSAVPTSGVKVWLQAKHCRYWPKSSRGSDNEDRGSMSSPGSDSEVRGSMSSLGSVTEDSGAFSSPASDNKDKGSTSIPVSNNKDSA